jgi:hypothetical protein
LKFAGDFSTTCPGLALKPWIGAYDLRLEKPSTVANPLLVSLFCRNLRDSPSLGLFESFDVDIKRLDLE